MISASLFVRLGAKPDEEEVGQRDQQDEDARRESHVHVAVGEVDFVRGARIPEEQHKDRDGGRKKEREESRRESEQQALEEAEAFQWKAEDSASIVLVCHDSFHRSA